MIKAITNECEQLAVSGGLTYVNCFDCGIVRCRCGKGFRYRLATGGDIKSKLIRKRIEMLVIPPAWRDVWICPDPNGHIQAIGRDDLGRKQYIYHPRWHKLSAATKFERMLVMPEVLPKIRCRVRQHLDGTQLNKQRVLAAIVRVLDRAHIRVGNEQYAKERDSRGATTLTKKHVSVDGFTVSLDFPGKSGKRNEVEFTDRKVAKVIRQCEEIDGHYLFSYLGEDGQLCQATSSDVNAYLQDISGEMITAKDFRTWWGSVAALDSLSNTLETLVREAAETTEADIKNKKASSAMQISATARKRAIVSAVREASQLLGNTMAVCRRSYVHPQIIDSFTAGTLNEELRKSMRYARRASRELKVAECRFHGWLLTIAKTSGQRATCLSK